MFSAQSTPSLEEHNLFCAPSSSLTPVPEAQDLLMGVKAHELTGAYIRALGRPSWEHTHVCLV